jgi:hypothetical protein
MQSSTFLRLYFSDLGCRDLRIGSGLLVIGPESISTRGELAWRYA